MSHMCFFQNTKKAGKNMDGLIVKPKWGTMILNGEKNGKSGAKTPNTGENTI